MGPSPKAQHNDLENGPRLAAGKQTCFNGGPRPFFTQIAELCCVLDFCGKTQHYPPSWVEALTSLDQVVIGSATPVGASQWGFFRFGSRAFVLGSRGTPQPPIQIDIQATAGKGEGSNQGVTIHRRRLAFASC